jgi:hypothetical protein
MRAPFLCVACFLFSSGCYGQLARDTLLEVSLLPEQGFVGEKRQLTVTLLTENWYTGAAEFPILKVDPAFVLQPKGFAINSSVTREGKRYAAQSRDYNIFPDGEGRLVIPPFEVRAPVAVFEGRLTVPATVTRLLLQEPLVFDVKALPGRVDVVATKLSVNDSLKSSPEEIEVGVIIEREIEIRATDTIAMLLPSLEAKAMNNVRIYHQAPTLNDYHERGSLQAVKRQKISYVFEKAGSFTLPEYSIRWWNSESQKIEELVVDSKEIKVVSFSSGRSLVRVAISVLVFTIFFVLIFWWCSKGSFLFNARNKYWTRLRIVLNKFYVSIMKQYGAKTLPPLNPNRQ